MRLKVEMESPLQMQAVPSLNPPSEAHSWTVKEQEMVRMPGLLSRETNEMAENGLGPRWLVVSGSFEVRVFFEDCRPLACSPCPHPFPRPTVLLLCQD